MAELRTFTVMRSRFPLGTPTEQLGTVEATDFGKACAVARAQFGRQAVVLPHGDAPAPALLRLADRRRAAGSGRRRA